MNVTPSARLRAMGSAAGVEAYAELMFMDDRSFAQIAPSGAFFVTHTLHYGNAFMSAQRYDTLCGRFGLGRDDVQTVHLGRRNV